MPTSFDWLALLDVGLRGVLVALLVLLSAALWRARLTSETAQGAVRLMLGMLVQVISSIPALQLHVPPLWRAALIAVGVGNVVLFWLFVRALFDDDFRPGRSHLRAWLGVVLFSACDMAVLPYTDSVWTRWAFDVRQAVPFLYAALAIWPAISSWRGDLIEARRGLRCLVVGIGIVEAMVQTLLQLSSTHGLPSAQVALLEVSLVLLLTAGMASRLVRLAPDELFRLTLEPAHKAGSTASRINTRPVSVADAKDKLLVENLLHIVRSERLYVEQNLGLAGLAARLAIPEHRLRRIINRRFGCRSFNAFVRSFRLEDAEQMTIDAAGRETAAATVAVLQPKRALKAAVQLSRAVLRRQSSGR